MRYVLLLLTTTAVTAGFAFGQSRVLDRGESGVVIGGFVEQSEERAGVGIRAGFSMNARLDVDMLAGRFDRTRFRDLAALGAGAGIAFHPLKQSHRLPVSVGVRVGGAFFLFEMLSTSVQEFTGELFIYRQIGRRDGFLFVPRLSAGANRSMLRVENGTTFEVTRRFGLFAAGAEVTYPAFGASHWRLDAEVAVEDNKPVGRIVVGLLLMR